MAVNMLISILPLFYKQCIMIKEQYAFVDFATKSLPFDHDLRLHRTVNVCVLEDHCFSRSNISCNVQVVFMN